MMFLYEIVPFADSLLSRHTTPSARLAWLDSFSSGSNCTAQPPWLCPRNVPGCSPSALTTHANPLGLQWTAADNPTVEPWPLHGVGDQIGAKLLPGDRIGAKLLPASMKTPKDLFH